MITAPGRRPEHRSGHNAAAPARKGPVALLAAALIVAVAALAFGLGSPGSLAPEILTVTGSDSARGDAILSQDFTVGRPQLLFKAQATPNVDDPAVIAAGLDLTKQIGAAAGVQEAGSYWSKDNLPLLRGSSRDFALILIDLKGTQAEQRATAVRLMDQFTGAHGPLTLEPTGEVPTQLAIEKQSKADLIRAVVYPAPIVIALLIAFFGLTTALITVGIALFSVSIGIGLLRVIDLFAPVSVFAINIVTALGLGLAANFTLYVITRKAAIPKTRTVSPSDPSSLRGRFSGPSPSAATRSVAFTSVTIAIGSGALLVFPMNQLRSFAYAGFAGVVGAGIGALLVLPVVLTLLGDRLDRFNKGLLTDARWEWLGRAVVRWPSATALIAVVLTAALTLPAFGGIVLADSNEKVLPPRDPVRGVVDSINEGMGGEKSGLMVVLPGLDPAAKAADIGNYATQLSKLEGVVRVDATTGSYVLGMFVKPPSAENARLGGPAGAVVSVSVKYPGADKRSIELAKRVRAVAAPGEALVSGGPAALLDAQAALEKRAPIAAGMLAVAVVLVLLWFSRSIVTGLLAVVSCGLTLAAIVGAVVVLFPDGIYADMTMLMLVVAFCFAMDRHLFLIGTIADQREEGNSSAAVVAKAVGAAAPVMAGTTVIIAVVLAAFATSGLNPMRELGAGLAVGVIVDVILMRILLVPAVMTLAGPSVWKLPAPAEKLVPRGAEDRKG